ncbi:MAG: hypothetical protein C0498_13020 [Anaerolinea sp.]|jgi:hypothetical protein|nr:hypothetical protein [Anaerolinea sp.]
MRTGDDLLRRHWSYLAILKGRQAEYAGLADVILSIRATVTPLIQLWQAQADPVARLASALTSLKTTMGTDGPILLDGDWLDDAAEFGRALESARVHGWAAVPVTSMGRSSAYQGVVASAVRDDRCGVALRVKRDDVGSTGASLSSRLDDLLDHLGVAPEDVDLILDHRAILDTQLEAAEVAGAAMIRLLPRLEEWRHVVLAGSGMPAFMKDFPREAITPIRRTEWWVYQGACERVRDLPRVPTFGDYGTTHPDPVENIDAKGALPETAQLRYATADGWLMLRGLDIRKHPVDHFVDLLDALRRRPEFSGATFSAGDRWIDDVASGRTPPGRIVMWKRMQLVHHLTYVSQQLARTTVP